jgi:poly(A) polymerase
LGNHQRESISREGWGEDGVQMNILDIILRNGVNNKPINGDEIRNAHTIMGFVTEKSERMSNVELDYMETWRQILEYKWSSHIMKRLDRLGLIKIFFPDLEVLKDVPQNKRKTLNAFQHTLKVLNEVDKRHDDIVMKLAALFHDLGKAQCWFGNANMINTGRAALGKDNFHYHEYHSEIIAAKILDTFPIITDPIQIKRLFTIIRYHMRPLAYQRQPNWKDSTICNFHYDVRSRGSNIFEIIDFAICDKLSTNKHIKHLEELRERAKGLKL